MHDAARPLVTPELIDRCVEQRRKWGCDGVVAAARAVDTIKEADAGGRVIATLERSHLWAVQTPQVFTAGDPARGARPRRPRRAPTTTPSWWRRSAATSGSSRRRARTSRSRPQHDLRIAELLLQERAQRLMLTDYHTHLRPDVRDTPPERYFTEDNVAALPRGRRARGIEELGFSEHVYRFREASTSGAIRSGSSAPSTPSTSTSSS